MTDQDLRNFLSAHNLSTAVLRTDLISRFANYHGLKLIDPRESESVFESAIPSTSSSFESVTLQETPKVTASTMTLSAASQSSPKKSTSNSKGGPYCCVTGDFFLEKNKQQFPNSDPKI